MEDRDDNVELAATDSTERGVPLEQATPDSGRRRTGLPEPFCSPIGAHSPAVLHSPGHHHHHHWNEGTPLSQPSPSPGSKRWMGVSNNARNDLYMKTLMNSPYHKSFTPLQSATPNGASPAYQTPIRGKSDKPPSPARGAVFTPSGTRPPGSGKKFFTPKNMVYNPFESGIDNLHLPAYISPGLFKIMSTPASEDKRVFQWSIEHIAELNPVEIEEMPVNQLHMHVDKETEERAQKAIDQFFSKELILPSPLTDPKDRKVKNILPATPCGQGGADVMMTELQGSIQKSLPTQKSNTEDVACQTRLSLPLDFDLQKVLGAYMTQDNAAEDGNQQEILSTSSLRRKLFFHGDTSSLAPSPVKGAGGDYPGDAGSPLFAKHRGENTDHVSPLKTTPAFSSSPIKSAGTPNYKRCSSDPEFLVSPQLSPIVHGHVPKTMHRTRSSGVFEVNPADLDMSPVSEERSGQKRCQSPVSPIPFHGISPGNDEEGFIRKIGASPEFSPIRPQKTQIRKILRHSQEESYLQDDGCSFSEDDVESVTPVSSNPSRSQHSHPNTPVQCSSPIHTTPDNRMAAFIAQSHSFSEGKETAMEFETEPIAGKDAIMTSSFCDTQEFSVSNVDSQDDTHTRTYSSSQDTGYQTASLQSTKAESVLLHTNLTNQFNFLPFNLTNQDLALSQMTNQDNMMTSFSRSDDNIESKKSALSISKQLFPSDPIFPDSPLFSENEGEDENTPKHQKFFNEQCNDSALPDDSAVLSGSMLKDFDEDLRKGNMGLVMSEGEEILSRAREALAMANSLYPKEGKCELPKPVIAKTQIVSDLQESCDHVEKKPKASDIALSIIQKAGEDLAKFENILSCK